MRPRNVLFIVVALLLLFIVLANWQVISQPTKISLLIGTLDAPLGLLLFVIAAAVFIIDLTLHSLNRLSWTRERKELTAQIEQHRLLADKAEESRIRELREVLERELAAIRVQLERLAAR